MTSARPPEAVRVLLVDDEPNVLASLARILRRKGFHVSTAPGATEALEELQGVPGAGAPFDVVVVDLKMPGMDGLTLLKRLKERIARLPVVVLTGYGSIRSAVDAMRSGAFEYLVKPSSPEEIIEVLRRAARSGLSPGAPPPAQSAEGPKPRASSRLVGDSAALRSVVEMVKRVAALPFTVLLRGESGTGKELLARTLHELSPRARGPFVPVNCATTTASLAESLFFGHRKGAFTGADADREGYFQAAHGGTLFLDEVGDLPEQVQGVLLRVLQEGSVRPVGSTRTVRIDARIVSATNRDLEADVRAGRFRADLFYRLDVVQLEVPPLRDRMDDLPLLVEAFLAEYRAWIGHGPQRVSEVVMGRFLAHPWPGNVREVRNVIERAIAVCGGDVIELAHLPSYLHQERGEMEGLSALDAAECRQIQAALAATGGEKKAAAEILGIDRKRLYRKLRRLGLFG